MDNQERRRGQHFNRGRRGPDRRGQERRPPPAPEQANRDHVDVEQIMRDIRARISQRHGIDLTTQQIQELAARRLEAILDPRAVKPALLDQLRRAAGAPADQPAAPAEPAYTFAEGAVFESHRGFVRLLRRLFKPLLMLFVNPTPVERALAAQSRINVEAAQRDAERQRQQVEWNALHYDILQRLVTEISRSSLEVQSLSAQVESLAAKVDFNERRVRHMEGSLHQARPSGRAAESAAAPAAPPPREPREPREPPPPRELPPPRESAPATEATPAAEPGTETPASGEASRRRRRRRRGRRGGGAPGEGAPHAAAAGATASTIGETAASPDDEPEEDGDQGEETPEQAAPASAAPAFEPVPVVHAHGQAAEPAVAPEPEPAPAPILAHVPEPEPEAAPAPIFAQVPAPEPEPAAEPGPEPQPWVPPPAAPETDRTE